MRRAPRGSAAFADAQRAAAVRAQRRPSEAGGWARLGAELDERRAGAEPRATAGPSEAVTAGATPTTEAAAALGAARDRL